MLPTQTHKKILGRREQKSLRGKWSGLKAFFFSSKILTVANLFYVKKSFDD
jgi:hypothetical protein